MGETILISGIGTTEYSEVEYGLKSRRWRTRFIAAALAHLVPDLRGGRAVVLATEKARSTSYNDLAEELRSAGMKPEPAAVPDGSQLADFLEIFRAITDVVPPGSSIILDVTYGLRALPFAYLASLTYLRAQRDVKVIDIYYGAFELRRKMGFAPIISLTPFLHHIDWHHALSVAKDTGDFRAVSEMFREEIKFVSGDLHLTDADLNKLKKPVEKLGEALAAGLPIEAGIHADKVTQMVKKIQARGGSWTRAAQLALEHLAEVAEPFSCVEKSQLVLTLEELGRELHFAEWLACRGDVSSVLLVLREWLINLVLLDRRENDNWLDYNLRRKSAETFLNDLAKAGTSIGKARQVGRLWDSLSQVRNEYAHAGMTTSNLDPNLNKIQEYLKTCRNLLGQVGSLGLSDVCLDSGVRG